MIIFNNKINKYYGWELALFHKLNELTLKQREELFRQLRISITHHSNAIEGTTLSFGETKELLELGHTAGHKPLGEQLIRN